MNVLIPTADYPPIEGGISSVALHLSRELAALGHGVTVVAPHFPGMEDFDGAEPVTVVRFGGYGLGWFRFFPMLAATWPHLRSTDLVLAINVAYGGVQGLLARRFRRIPYVTFAYAYEFLKFAKTPLVGWLLRKVYANARAVVSISQFTRDQLAAFGVDGRNVAVVYPGATPADNVSNDVLDAARHRFMLEDCRVILAVGRLIPRKGQVTLVRALPRVLERFPNIRLVIVGQGPTVSEVSREANRLDVREHVLVPGRLEDDEVAALYALCDVFALPTGVGEGGQVEGFGLVFSEAHAHGKPVIAGRSGGVPEAVLDEETGLLVKPDSPDALAEALIRLFEDPALARRLGEDGRRRVEEELNWSEFTRRVLAEVETRS